jgi:hypothetical protein
MIRLFLIIAAVLFGGMAAVVDRIDDDGVVLAWRSSVDLGMFLLFLLNIGDRSNQKVINSHLRLFSSAARLSNHNGEEPHSRIPLHATACHHRHQTTPHAEAVADNYQVWCMLRWDKNP